MAAEMSEVYPLPDRTGGSSVFGHATSEMGSTTRGSDWHRSFSASDIVGMQRTPKRRPFDHPHPARDGMGGNRLLEASSLPTLGYGDHDQSWWPDETPKTRSVRERAVDFWKVGESMRIMHHIEPKKFRAISLYGEVFQGFYNSDWHSIEHVQHQRQRYPATRATWSPGSAEDSVPYPQGRTQQEINRNRNFGRSHGGTKITGGILRVGGQLIVP